MRISLIVAASENNVIGNNNAIPWHLPDDLKYFRTTTEGHPVIMGRKNYDSILKALGKPLPNRRNIIVTRDQTYSAPGCEVASSLDEAIMFARKDNDREKIFIIGGGEIYAQAMELSNEILMTRVHATIDGDVYFPAIDETVWEETKRTEHPADGKHAYAFSFVTYERRGSLHLD